MTRGARLGVALVAAAVVVLGAAAGGAGAATGTAGPISVTVLPVTSVRDGQTVNIDVRAPAGVVIYEIRAHLCLPGADLRSNFDFGFQGRRCTNIAVGHGDFEQSVAYPSGVAAGSLNTFKVGSGTASWVNELGYPASITCGPGHPCNLVVRVEITDDTVFYTAPLCYDAACATNDGGTPTSTSAFPSSTTTPAGGIQASGGAKRTGTKGSVANGRTTTAARRGGSGSDIRVGAVASPAGLSTPRSAAGRADTSRVLVAALAGMVAGGWIATAIANRRRRKLGASTT
jgi:hypothetical protein